MERYRVNILPVTQTKSISPLERNWKRGAEREGYIRSFSSQLLGDESPGFVRVSVFGG